MKPTALASFMFENIVSMWTASAEEHIIIVFSSFTVHEYVDN